MKRLDGKVALITGAASGLGKAMAVLFASEGATVVITDIDVEGLSALHAEISSDGGNAKSLTLDVSDQNAWMGVIETVKKDLGKLNILVNNAGYVPLGGIEDASCESVENGFAVMIYGPIFGMQAAIPLMKAGAEPCAILNVSSVCGAYVATENNLVYNTAKSALVGITRAAAVDLAKTNIRVNAIHPGTISGTAISGKVLQGDTTKIKLSKIPMGRLGIPEDVANTALFLCSDEASYIHGASLVIDGGQILGYRDPKSY